ncbi:MAG: DUF2029 domain-containing protein [Bryobacteraceae bacterium]|nr:DUF2029 domain-containing protein [Bryobacteraceae bacterium]
MTIRRLEAALIPVTLLAATAGLMLTLTWPLRELIFGGGNDFLSFYAGGRLAGGEELYSREAARAIQREAAGIDSETLPFIRMPYYAAALKPLSSLPYLTAYAVWQALNLAAWAAFALLMPGPSRLTVIALSACAISIYVSFLNGQDLPLILLFLAAALRLEGRAGFRAGLCLSLCLAKFHLFLFVPAVVLLRRRWRLAAGSAVGVSALLAVSFAVGGAAWPAAYVKALANGNFHSGSVVTPNIAGLLAISGLPSALLWPIGAAFAAAVCLAALRRPFPHALSAALIAGVLVAPHAFLQDTALLLPASLLLRSPRPQRPVRVLATLMAIPPLYAVEFLCLPPWGSLLPLGAIALFIAFLVASPPAPAASSRVTGA